MIDHAGLLQQWISHGRSLAPGLPDWAYTSWQFWQLECDSVFADNWTCAGFAHEIGNPGDVMPVSIAGKPILLVRQTGGKIAGFHNVCRHRCLTLVDGPKNVGKLIRCPYHAWAYDLNGELRASPHFGGMDANEPEGFDRTDNGLVPVRTHVWHDWIFVNLSGTAPAFNEYAAPLIRHLEGIDFTIVEPVAVLDFGEIATNWKFIMENFIEPYHVQFVHTTTTDQPLKDHYTIVDGVCLGSAVDLETEVGSTKSLAVSSRYLTLFPNFVLGRYFPDQIGVYLNLSLGADRVLQKRGIYTTHGKELGPHEVEGLKSLWWYVHKEDHEMCERLQQGRASPVAALGGLLSPHWENSVRAFQELIAHGVAQKESQY